MALEKYRAYSLLNGSTNKEMTIDVIRSKRRVFTIEFGFTVDIYPRNYILDKKYYEKL